MRLVKLDARQWVNPEHIEAVVQPPGSVNGRSQVHLAGGSMLVTRGTPEQVVQVILDAPQVPLKLSWWERVVHRVEDNLYEWLDSPITTKGGKTWA